MVWILFEKKSFPNNFFQIQLILCRASPNPHPVGDNHFLNFAGTFVDLRNLGVAHHALHGIVADITITAEKLQTAAGNIAGILGRHQFRHGRQMAVLLWLSLAQAAW